MSFDDMGILKGSCLLRWHHTVTGRYSSVIFKDTFTIMSDIKTYEPACW